MKRMPNFLLPIFRLPFFSWSFSFFVILNSNFSVALLFLPSQFSLRVYPLHNFPLPIFSDAVSVSFISYINFVLPCIPTLLFFVADFSGCPIFRLPFLPLPFFFRCPFYRCRFCRESRLDLGRSHSFHHHAHLARPSTSLTSRWASRVDNLHTSHNMLEHDSFLPRGIWYGLVSVCLSVCQKSVFL